MTSQPPILAFLALVLSHLAAAQGISEIAAIADTERRIVPVAEFVRARPEAGGATEYSAVALDRSELSRLTIRFLRDSLGLDDGVQFLRITTTVTRRDGTLVDKIVEKAFTYGSAQDSAEDEERMRTYSRAIHPLGIASRRRIDSVEVDLEELPDWALIEVRVEPDEDFVAYAHHRGNRITWHYRVRGKRFDGAFYLGIPKVLYDSRDRDGLDYGRTSAMYRFFWLDDNTGVRFPVNIGLGVFGVRTPIDVSSNGGGFALSGLLDVFEVARLFGLELTTKINAGLEVVPFFPLEQPARVLLSIRVGIAP